MADEQLTFIAADGTVWSPDYIIALDGLGAGPSRSFRQSSPYFEGATYLDVQQQSRVLTVGFAIAAASRADFYAQRASAIAALSTAKGPGTLRFTVPGIGDRVLTCVVETGPTFSSASRIGILGTRDMVRFVADDPAWYDPAAGSISFIGQGQIGLTFPLTFPFTFGNNSLAGQQTASVAGDLDTWPVITIVGPGTAPKVTVTYASGEQLVASFPTLTLGAGDTLAVDHRPGYQSATLTTFASGATSNALGLRSADSYFWWLPGGAAVPIAASMTDTTTQTSITVTYYHRYSGI